MFNTWQIVANMTRLTTTAGHWHWIDHYGLFVEGFKTNHKGGCKDYLSDPSDEILSFNCKSKEWDLVGTSCIQLIFCFDSCHRNYPQSRKNLELQGQTISWTLGERSNHLPTSTVNVKDFNIVAIGCSFAILPSCNKKMRIGKSTRRKSLSDCHQRKRRPPFWMGQAAL